MEDMIIGALLGAAVGWLFRRKSENKAAQLNQKAFDDNLAAARSSFLHNGKKGHELFAKMFPQQFQASLQKVIDMPEDKLRMRFNAEHADFSKEDEDMRPRLPDELTDKTYRELAIRWLLVSDVELVAAYEKLRRAKMDLIGRGLTANEAWEEIWG